MGKPGLASCMYNRLILQGWTLFFKAPFLYLRVSATRNSSGPNREPYLLIRLLFFTIMAQNVAQFNCQTVLDDCSSFYVGFFLTVKNILDFLSLWCFAVYQKDQLKDFRLKQALIIRDALPLSLHTAVIHYMLEFVI